MPFIRTALGWLRLPVQALAARGIQFQVAALSLSGAIVVGAICLVGLRLEADSQHTADTSAALATNASALSENFLQARQLATEFLQKRKEDIVTRHGAMMQTVGGNLAEIETIVAPFPDGDPIKDTSGLRATINLYATRLNNVVAAQRQVGLSENDGLQGKLRGAVHAVEKRLNEFNRQKLSVLMLMMRRHEKDFMLRGDEKYGDELKKRVVEFKAAMKDAGVADDVRAQLEKLIDDYQRDFLAFMLGQSTLNEEAEDLVQVYSRGRPLLVALRTTSMERYSEAKTFAETVRQSMLGAIALTILVTIILAIYFGRRISRPLSAMAQAMQQVASGNLDIAVAASHRRDEIGAMSAALPCSTRRWSRTARWRRNRPHSASAARPSASACCSTSPHNWRPKSARRSSWCWPAPATSTAAQARSERSSATFPSARTLRRARPARPRKTCRASPARRKSSPPRSTRSRRR